MNKQKMALALGGATLIFAFVVAAYLYRQGRDERVQEMATEAESPLNRAYSPTLGPDSAKVTIVEFFDPGCEACAVFAPIVKQILDSHPGKVRLVLRYTPFHVGADTMVKILEASRKQNKYWETLDLMFATQQHWASHHEPKPERIWHFLPSAGLDIDLLKREMESAEIAKILEQDMADAQTLNVRKTPQFFVNGKELQQFGRRQLETLVRQEVDASYSGS